jgi:hypothetical protein
VPRLSTRESTSGSTRAWAEAGKITLTEEGILACLQAGGEGGLAVCGKTGLVEGELQQLLAAGLYRVVVTARAIAHPSDPSDEPDYPLPAGEEDKSYPSCTEDWCYRQIRMVARSREDFLKGATLDSIGPDPRIFDHKATNRINRRLGYVRETLSLVTRLQVGNAKGDLGQVGLFSGKPEQGSTLGYSLLPNSNPTRFGVDRYDKTRELSPAEEFLMHAGEPLPLPAKYKEYLFFGLYSLLRTAAGSRCRVEDLTFFAQMIKFLGVGQALTSVDVHFFHPSRSGRKKKVREKFEWRRKNTERLSQVKGRLRNLEYIFQAYQSVYTGGSVEEHEKAEFHLDKLRTDAGKRSPQIEPLLEKLKELEVTEEETIKKIEETARELTAKIHEVRQLVARGELYDDLTRQPD